MDNGAKSLVDAGKRDAASSKTSSSAVETIGCVWLTLLLLLLLLTTTIPGGFGHFRREDGTGEWNDDDDA